MYKANVNCTTCFDIFTNTVVICTTCFDTCVKQKQCTFYDVFLDLSEHKCNCYEVVWRICKTECQVYDVFWHIYEHTCKLYDVLWHKCKTECQLYGVRWHIPENKWQFYDVFVMVRTLNGAIACFFWKCPKNVDEALPEPSEPCAQSTAFVGETNVNFTTCFCIFAEKRQLYDVCWHICRNNNISFTTGFRILTNKMYI